MEYLKEAKNYLEKARYELDKFEVSFGDKIEDNDWMEFGLSKEAIKNTMKLIDRLLMKK